MSSNRQVDDEQERDHSQVFCCYAPDLRPMAILLSAVHFSARAIVQISDAGIHVEVEVGKILQAHAYLDKTAFSDWHFNPPLTTNTQKERDRKLDSDDSRSKNGGTDEEEEEDLAELKFEISLTSLIECLNVFGTATSQKSHRKPLVVDTLNTENYQASKPLFNNENGKTRSDKSFAKSRKQPASAVRISYDGQGHPLVLVIEDSGVVTRCSLVTYEADEPAQMEFPLDRQVVHLVMKSDWLKSAFSQFDDKTGSEITFTFSPNPPGRPTGKRTHKMAADQAGLRPKRPTFRIEVDGELGCHTIDFPNERDILDSFECKVPEGMDPQDFDLLGFVRNSYKLSHLLKIKKALDVSNKTSLRVDDTGFLSIQLLIPLEETTTLKTKSGYVEFLCVPIEEG